MTLSHRKAKLYLEMALDRPLSEAMQASLDTHLVGCAECRAYDEQLARFDDLLARSLSDLGDAPPASAQTLAQTAVLAQSSRRRYQAWQPFRTGWQLATSGVMLVVLIGVAFWFLRPPETAVDEISQTPEPQVTADPERTAEPSEAITALTSDYVVVHFAFAGAVEGLELYHPACDGMAYIPQPEMLASAAAEGETNYCELIASNTLLLKPGESRQLLLVYRNSQEDDAILTFEPQSVNVWERPFIQAICNQDDVRANQDCANHDVHGEGVWARYITVQTPETAQLGSSIVVRFNVRRQSLPIKPSN